MPANALARRADALLGRPVGRYSSAMRTWKRGAALRDSARASPRTAWKGQPWRMETTGCEGCERATQAVRGQW